MEALNVGLSERVILKLGDVTLTDEAIRGRRVRLALAYLVLERHHPVTPSGLARALWPEGPPASWPSSLREIISRVRRSFAIVGCAGAVFTRNRMLHVALPEDIHVDVEHALADARALAQGATAATADGAITPDMATQAERILDVAGFDFLGDEEGQWVQGWRERLRHARLVALAALAKAAMASGDVPAAADLARRMIDEDATTEVGYDLLIRSHRRAGRRAEALRTYEGYRRLLAEQLGIDPPGGMQSLHVDLLREDAGPPRSAQTAGSRPASMADTATPLLSSVGVEVPFVGRRGVLDTVRHGVADERTDRIVLVQAEACAGKTRLLAELVRQDALPAGPVLYGRCEPGAPDACGAIYQALGDHSLTPDGALSEITDAVSGLIRRGDGKTVTLLLDDVHWADEATARFVTTLVRYRSLGSVALVATYTTPQRGHRLTQLLSDLHSTARCVDVDLDPLEREDVQELKRRVTASNRADAPPDAWLLEQSGGNAGYLAGLLVAHAEGDTRGVPRALSARITASLDALTPTAHALLRAAAVAGQRFPVYPAAQAAALTGSDGWLQAADDLITRGLLAPVDGAAATLRFRHGVVRRVVLDAMGPLLRQRLERSRAAAEWSPASPTHGQRPANSRPARRAYRHVHRGEIPRGR